MKQKISKEINNCQNQTCALVTASLFILLIMVIKNMTTKIKKKLNDKKGKSVPTSDILFVEGLKSIDVCIQCNYLFVDISKSICAFSLLLCCSIILLQVY